MFTLPFGYVLLLNAICSASSWFISDIFLLHGCKWAQGYSDTRGQARFFDNNASENL